MWLNGLVWTRRAARDKAPAKQEPINRMPVLPHFEFLGENWIAHAAATSVVLYRESNEHWYVYMTLGGFVQQYDWLGLGELSEMQLLARKRHASWLTVLAAEATRALAL